MAEIVVIGSLNMDLTVNVPRIPSPGETISGGSLNYRSGGKGANQAIACANLGRDVLMIGSVGQDDFGQLMIKNLQSMNVDSTGIKKNADVPSGTAMILVDKNGENCIVLSSGANQYVELDKNLQKVIEEANIVLVQLEINIDVVHQVIDIAKKANVPVLLNPAPAVPLSDELLKKIEILIPNETEASILTDVVVDSISSAKEAAHQLVERGVKTVIITLGSKGAIMSNKELCIHMPALETPVFDTTGAGDAFIGGFASAIVSGKEIRTALEMALACGALATSKVGAQDSLPTLDEVDSFLQNYKEIEQVIL